LEQCPYAAAVSLIASLGAISGSDADATGLIPPRLTPRPRGAALKPEIGLCAAIRGTRQAYPQSAQVRSYSRARHDIRMARLSDAGAGVVRVGDTVRRPVGSWTPAVHALLNHLHRAGFRGAPPPWAALSAAGHGDAWRADADYIARTERDWSRALLGD